MASPKPSIVELATEAEGTDAFGGFIDQLAQGLQGVQDKVGVETALREVVRQMRQERDQAIRGLREELTARMQRLEVRMERMEETRVPSVTVAGNRESAETGMLERLERRMENVEARSTARSTVPAFMAQQEETSPPAATLLAPSESNSSTITCYTPDSNSLPSFTSTFISSLSSHSTYNSIFDTNLPSTSAAIILQPYFASALGETAMGTAASGTEEEPFACLYGAATNDKERIRQQLQLKLRSHMAKWEEAKAAPSLQGERLCVACHIGNLQEVVCLLDSGADVNYLNSSGGIPLIYSVDKSDPDEVLVSTLLESGADPHAVDRNGLTALHCAAVNDRSGSIVAKLIKAGSDVDPRIDCGATPLHFAAINNNEVAVRTLLAAGAKKSLVLWDGSHKHKTPFDLATSDAVRDLLR